MTARPLLVIRARIDPMILAQFEHWYRHSHLPTMMKIPGIVKAYRCNCHRPGINWATLYEFADESAIEDALASPQAGQARQDWQRWLPHVSEVTVEVYAPLTALPPYHHWN